MKADKRSLALLLALVLICTVLPVPPAQAADVQPVLSAALARQASAVPSPGYGDEWTMLGLARGGGQGATRRRSAGAISPRRMQIFPG